MKQKTSFIKYFHLLDETMIFFYGLVLQRCSIQMIKSELITYLIAKTSSEFILSGAVNLSVQCYDLQGQEQSKITDLSIINCSISIAENNPISYCKTILVAKDSKQNKEVQKFKKQYEQLQKIFFTLKEKLEEVYLLQEKINLSFLSFDFFSFFLVDEQKNIYGNFQNNFLNFKLNSDFQEKNYNEVQSEILLAPNCFYQFFFFSAKENIFFSHHFVTDEYKIHFLDKHSNLLIL